MRRLISMAAFAFGAYYLWYSNDRTVQSIAVGAMGLSVLVEFLGAD